MSELIKGKDGKMLTDSPSGDMLFGTKTTKEIQTEQKQYIEKMLNEEVNLTK